MDQYRGHDHTGPYGRLSGQDVAECTAVVNWTGKVGYDPSTIPYNGAPAGTSTPNHNFNAYLGPYRARQNTKPQMFFDEIKFSDTCDEAVP
jgi:hypothetical protein